MQSNCTFFIYLSQSSAIVRPNIQQNNPKALIVQQPQVNLKYIKQLQSPGPVYKPVAAAPAMTEAISLPLGVPAFKPIPKVFTNAQPTSSSSQSTFNRKTIMYQPTSFQGSTGNNDQQQQQLSRLNTNQIVRRQSNSNIPSFQAMPSKSAMSRISTGQIVQIDNNYNDNIQVGL